MKRPVTSAQFRAIPAGPPCGYTLVEILVASALTLVMMAVVVQIFASIGESVSDSRATLEMAERVRATRTLLEMDLAGVTVTMLPPRRPEAAEGYFEYIEGPVGPVTAPSEVAVNTDDPSNPIKDTTVGDFDDRLMFTTGTSGRPFVGRYWDPDANAQSTMKSDVAEIAWFLRGWTLYRRVLLVAPGARLASPAGKSFFAANDISVRQQGDKLVANTLGDLTKRQWRYAHDIAGGFPFDARVWGQLGLPTLRECSAAWPVSPISKTAPQIDFWNDPHPWDGVDKVTGTLAGYEGPRVAEDVVLTNVIGFDVKAWDPGAGAYVDLGAPAAVRFAGPGDSRSRLHTAAARVYDTWSFHYEHDGFDQDGDGVIDEGTNGFDDNGAGGVDDATEWETSPPYPVALRGIQVKIRVFEPDSRHIREVTVVQDFLPK